MPEFLREIHPLVLVILLAVLYLLADVGDRKRMERLAKKREEDEDDGYPF